MAHGIRQISDIEGHVVHPAANMFPMMGTEEFKSLMQDI